MSAAADPAAAANLAALAAESAGRRPERPAIVEDGAPLPYSELDARCSRAAGALQLAGARPGSRVALLLPNGSAFVAAYYGALRLGATAVPLNPLLAGEEVALRIAHSGASILVTAPGRARELPGPLPAILDPADLPAGDPIDEIAPVAGTDTAVVLYTSGTTGDARGVELTHDGFRSAARGLGAALGTGHDDVVLGAAPLAHVFGQCAVLNMTIAAGATIAFVPRFDAEQTLGMLARDRVSVFLGVPTMCLDLLRVTETAATVPRLRVAHVGAAPLASETLRLFSDRFGCTVLEGYGLTEAAGVVATHRAGRPVKAGSVGEPVEGTEIRIDGGPPGEVLVRGPGVMRGYLDNSRATGRVLSADGWLRTGDVGYLDDDGYLFLVDRKKDVILRGGYTVYPREIEEVLYRHANVREAVVVGVPDPRLGEEVVALVVPRRPPGDPDEIRAYVRERVAGYKYPRLVIAVDELPHGPSGKIERRRIDRDALARRFAATGRTS